MDATKGDTRKKLGWVELGRGCAAFIVFLAHGFFVDFPKELSFLFLWGRWGVDFFFVLSGFIIAYVHWPDIGHPDRFRHFCWRRFVRIFPTYWLALAALIFVRNVLGNSEYRIDLGAEHLVGNIVMWPGIPELMLTMAWTLRHEILFYALFSLMILNARIGAVAFACWLALLLWTLFTQTPCETLTVAAERCMASNAALPPHDPAWQIVSLNVNLYFFVGIGLARCLQAEKIGYVLAATLFSAVIAFCLDQWTGSPYALAALQASIIVFFVSLAIYMSDRIPAPRIAYWFGAISYPLYLFHMTAMLITHGVIKRVPFEMPWQFTAALALILSLVISHAIAFHFENRARAISRKLAASISRAA